MDGSVIRPAAGETVQAASFRRPLRVLLCPDEPDWAFHNIARNIVRHAPDGFEVSIHFMGKPGQRDLGQLIETIILNDVDVVHMFWREDMFEIVRPPMLIDIAGKLRMPVGDVIDLVGARALTTSVYDHLHASEESMQERAAAFRLIDGYTVCSGKLDAIYGAQRLFPLPDAIIPDGVDLAMFGPRGEAGGAGPEEPLSIGWVGNSNWGRSQGGDPKGFHRLFQPAVDLLRNAGVPVEIHRADPQLSRIPFAEMPAFYRRIDVLACTASMEGTPNPVLEAMASGAAVVSTDVGIVPELFGPLQSRYLLRDPTPEALAGALRHLAADRGRLRDLGRENLETISAWSWQETVRGWWPFFTEAARRARDPRLAGRRREALLQGCYAYFNHLGLSDRGGTGTRWSLRRALASLNR